MIINKLLGDPHWSEDFLSRTKSIVVYQNLHAGFEFEVFSRKKKEYLLMYSILQRSRIAPEQNMSDIVVEKPEYLEKFDLLELEKVLICMWISCCTEYRKMDVKVELSSYYSNLRKLLEIPHHEIKNHFATFQLTEDFIIKLNKYFKERCLNYLLDQIVAAYNEEDKRIGRVA